MGNYRIIAFDPYDRMHKLANAYTIKDTSIGGERFHSLKK